MNESVILLCAYVLFVYFVYLFLLHNMVVEIGALTLRPIQMPPRPATRGRPATQPGPSATRGDNNPSTEDPIARGLNRMAEVM
jgi:hypothetical protein